MERLTIGSYKKKHVGREICNGQIPEVVRAGLTKLRLTGLRQTKTIDNRRKHGIKIKPKIWKRGAYEIEKASLLILGHSALLS